MGRADFRCLIIASMLCVFFISACGGGPPPIESTDAFRSTAGRPLDEIYRLGTGDEIRISVFGEENLSGEFTVDDAGVISMPLIGLVEAAGRTPRELAATITERLKDGYLRNPRVSTQIIGYRPFYIYGEVQNPGNYPFTIGLHVIEAIATAGGFTYRADQDEVYITRNVGGESQEFAASTSVRVFPGDIIKVPERYF